MFPLNTVRFIFFLVFFIFIYLMYLPIIFCVDRKSFFLVEILATLIELIVCTYINLSLNTSFIEDMGTRQWYMATKSTYGAGETTEPHVRRFSALIQCGIAGRPRKQREIYLQLETATRRACGRTSCSYSGATRKNPMLLPGLCIVLISIR